MKKLIKKLFMLGICSLTLIGCQEQKQPEPQPSESQSESVHFHNFAEHHDEVAATCTQSGMEEYFKCSECGQLFDKERNEVTEEQLVIPALGHDVGSIWFESEGYHYHLCNRCSAKVDVDKHSLHEVAATPADHDHDGTFLHYECDVCHIKFLDSYGMVALSHIETGMTGHDAELTYHPEVPATCETKGVKAYYSCSCGALFEDAAGTKRIENPIEIPALGHISNGIWKSDGTKHWHTCFRCSKVIDEENHTSGSETHQDLVHSWKYCSICGHKVDEQELIITGCHHDRLLHYEELKPTLTEPGHIEYYYCCDCHKSYYDAACTQEIEHTEYGVHDKRDDRYLSPLPSTFNILNKNLRDYLDAKNDQEAVAALRDKSVYNYQAMKTITWEDNLKGPYTVEVSNTRLFSEFKSYTSTMPALTLEGTLMPGETYFYRVKDSTDTYILDDVSFKVSDKYSLRTITIDGVSNVRDLGGWVAKDGKQVPYGKLYRGGELKVIQSSGRNTYLNTLGIKTEIDLRGDNPQQVITDSGLSYRNYPIWMYTSIIPDFSITYPDGPTFNYESYSVTSIKSIFETLADPNNYPVYYHCSAGADRTGTLSYLINGLLGVSYEDLTKDFELTSFSVFGDRYRSFVNEDDTFDSRGYYCNSDGNWMGWGKMNDIMDVFYGETNKPLYVTIENYLKEACGVSAETIAAVRRNLLGEDVDFSM